MKNLLNIRQRICCQWKKRGHPVCRIRKQITLFNLNVRKSECGGYRQSINSVCTIQSRSIVSGSRYCGQEAVGLIFLFDVSPNSQRYDCFVISAYESRPFPFRADLNFIYGKAPETRSCASPRSGNKLVPCNYIISANLFWSFAM